MDIFCSLGRAFIDSIRGIWILSTDQRFDDGFDTCSVDNIVANRRGYTAKGLENIRSSRPCSGMDCCRYSDACRRNFTDASGDVDFNSNTPRIGNLVGPRIRRATGERLVLQSIS